MRWNNEFSILIPLTVTIVVYLWGLQNLWQRAGAGHGIPVRRAIQFLGAIVALLVALASPLDVWSDELFAAHMVQHLILILIAAPLLVMCDFPLALLWALPRRLVRMLAPRLYHAHVLSRGRQTLTSPIAAWLAFTINMWTWHAPILFEWALADEMVHALEHLGFLLTAMLFWWVLFKHTRPNHVHYAMAVPYLFATFMQSNVLGALMAFTAQPWYPYYANLATKWGLSPLQDQQLAGITMWILGGFVFTFLTIAYFAAWLGALEQRSALLQQRNYLNTRQD